MSDALLAAYRRTQYQATTPLGSLTLRIGEHSALLDELLTTHNAHHWAYITAWNPGSIVLPKPANDQRQRVLQTLLANQGYPFYSGFGYPNPEQDSHWAAEASVLVINILPQAARTLAQQFGQWALLSGHHGGIAELVVLNQALLKHTGSSG